MSISRSNVGPHQERTSDETQVAPAGAGGLVDELEKRDRQASDPKSSYEAMKARAAARNAELARAGQEIGELPAVVDPQRKANASGNFRVFCETYFPEIFYLSWSRDYHRVIEKIEKAVLNGSLFAMATQPTTPSR